MNNKYQNEVNVKYKNTEAYKEYLTKSKYYTEDQFNIINQNFNSIFIEFSNLLKNGIKPNDPLVQSKVKYLKDFISSYYYTCTNEILKSLSEIYTSDERFKKNIDKNWQGTSTYIKQAIDIYCLNNK